MAMMCDICKCSTYLDEDTGMYSCENECPCCNDPDFVSDEDMLVGLIEFIQKLSVDLNKEDDTLNAELDAIEDMNSDDYKFKEIEQISNMGKILGINKVLAYIEENIK